jgi:Right handed beta helix region
MKTLRITLCLIGFCCFFQNYAFSQKIYLSPSGDDKNPGTIDNPLATLQAARDKARLLRRNTQPGQPVEIIALKGRYSMLQPLELSAEDSGTPASPLIVRAEEGARVQFSAGVEITGFQRVNENLWKTFIPQVAFYNWYCEQLYVNGKRAVRARTPDEGFYFIKNASETAIVKGKDSIPKFAVQHVRLDSIGANIFRSFSDLDFGDVVVNFYHKWDNTRKHIDTFNDSLSEITISGAGMQPWNSFDSKTSYYVENYKAALDAPGEWYLERSGTLWYVPRKDETPENTSFTAPLLKNFIEIEGEKSPGGLVKNIRFENLTFENSGYQMPVHGNDAAQAASPVEAVITLDYAENISFKNCEIAHTGMYTFWFRRACSNCSVNQCYMHDLGAGGVKIGETIIRQDTIEITRNITIDNNIIRDAGHIFPCAVGIIIFNASDNKLTHNEIADLRYTGISVGWVWGYTPSPSKRNKIEFNHIHHLGWGELSDMGGVYTLGASEGTTVSNNVIHHIYSFDYGGWGLYTDEGSFGITEENNLVYACKNSGFHQHYGKENIIRNNIFAMNIRAQLQATRVEEHRSIIFTNNIVYFEQGTLLSNNWNKFNLLTDKNCYWDVRTKNIMFDDKSFTDWQKSGKDIHSVIADPQFVNPDVFDFHFKKLTVARKIKFKPFDYSKAGVYGSDKWKKLAQYDTVLSGKYDDIVNLMETKMSK